MSAQKLENLPISLFNSILAQSTAEFSPMLIHGLKIHPVVFHFTKDLSIKAVAEHEHRFAEFSWLITGSMDYRIGKDHVELCSRKKKSIFIPPRTPHERCPLQQNSLILGFLLDLSPINEEGERFLEAICALFKAKAYTFGKQKFLSEFEKKLMMELQAPDHIFLAKINFYIYEFLFSFLDHFFYTYLMKCPPIPKKLNKNDNIVVGVKQLIEENIATIPSLAVLAKKYAVSERHINRLFKEHTGSSVGTYICQRKLNAAQRMLYNPKLSIKEIAYSLGFQGSSYFCHFVKKHTGLTPLEYSQQVNVN